jgi:hypothetical protein
MLSKSVKKYGGFKWKFISAIKYIMSITELTVAKLNLARQIFAKTSYKNFHKNPTDGLVLNTEV